MALVSFSKKALDEYFGISTDSTNEVLSSPNDENNSSQNQVIETEE
jgi:hypothetical protein